MCYFGVRTADHDADHDDGNKGDDAGNDKFDHERAEEGAVIDGLFAFDGNLIEIGLIVHMTIIAQAGRTKVAGLGAGVRCRISVGRML